MTRKLLLFSCWALFLAGLAAAFAAQRVSYDYDAPAGGVARLAELPASFIVDVSAMTGALRGLSRRDVDDQLRDWAVYGTFVKAGVDPDTMLRSTHKVAPVRLPYLEDNFLFDYGSGRRAIVGEKDVWLFYEHGDPDPQATLGRLADKVRMEIGELPESFRVFEATPDLQAGEIRVDRKPPIRGADMFSPAYGYVERTVTSRQEFEDWLGLVDDVTYVKRATTGVTFGGRRFEKSRTRNVTVEDIAALYQAHTTLAQQRKELEGKLDDINDDFRAAARLLPNRSGVDALRREYEKKAADLPHPPREPGFSLDPQWKMDRFTDDMQALAEDPYPLFRRALRVAFSDQDDQSDDAAKPFLLWQGEQVAQTAYAAGGPKAIDGVFDQIAARYGQRLKQIVAQTREAGANDEPPVDYWKLARQDVRNDASDHANSVLDALLEFVRADAQVQCARYDGPLKGTAVGMNLFYTDLLAKLWLGLDYNRTAPALVVPGFLSLPRLHRDPTYADEERKLTSTRLWFGVKPESFSRAQDEGTIWFEHIGTRVYAAGSNPAEPGKEAQPSDSSRRALGWWDRHYAGVGDYEQEYHVQNQIMKWSVVTGWLQQADKASYLSQVNVRRDYRFDRWLDETRDRLRYRNAIALTPESEWIKGTECVPIFASYIFQRGHQMSGGVSLGGKESIELVPRLVEAESRMQRFTATVRALDSEGVGTAARARPIYESPGKVLVKATENTRWRAGASDLHLGDVEVAALRSSAETTNLSLRGEKGAIGAISSRAEPDGVQLDWSPSDVEYARTVANEAVANASEESGSLADGISRTGRRGIMILDDKGDVLLSAPRSDAAVLVRSAAADRSGSDAVVSTAREHVRLGVDEARKPHLESQVVSAQADLLQPREIRQVLDQYEWQRLTVDPKDEGAAVTQAVRRSFSHRPPPAGAREVTLKGVPEFDEGIHARITDAGEIFLPKPSAERQLAVWRDIDERTGLTAQDLQRLTIETRAASGKAFQLNEAASRRAEAALRQFEGDDYPNLLRTLAADATKPTDLKVALQALEQRARDSADFHLVHADGESAGRLYQKVNGTFGDASKDAMLRQGLAEIAEGQSVRGIKHLEDTFASPETMAPDTKQTLRRFVNAAGDDLGDFRLYARSLLGDEPGIPPEIMRHMQLRPDGPSTMTVFKMDRPLHGHQVAFKERSELVNDRNYNVVAYIDDSFSLNKVDTEGASGELLAQMAQAPDVRWVEVDQMPVGNYHPGLLVDTQGGNQYRRVSSKPGLHTQGTRVVVIQRCDRDGDGVVSAEERRLCDVAL